MTKGWAITSHQADLRLARAYRITLDTQENSGLAEVVPIDYINETIKARHDREKTAAPTRVDDLRS